MAGLHRRYPTPASIRKWKSGGGTLEHVGEDGIGEASRGGASSPLVIRASGVATRLVLVPLIGFGFTAWWLVGDVSEPGGEDSILQLPFAQRQPRALGVLGLVLAAIWATDWFLVWRRADQRFPALWLSAAGVTAGLLAGAGMRVVTARVGGANIGGGMVILTSPLVAISLVAVTIWLALRIARRQPQHPQR